MRDASPALCAATMLPETQAAAWQTQGFFTAPAGGGEKKPAKLLDSSAKLASCAHTKDAVAPNLHLWHAPVARNAKTSSVVQARAVTAPSSIS